MQKFFSVDATHDPIVVITLQGQVSEQRYREHLLDMESRLYAKKRYGQVIDYSGIARLPQSLRKMQAEWIKEHFDHIEKESLGTAAVSPRTLDRFALSAILLITKMPKHTWVVGSVSEGIETVKACIAKNERQR